MIRTVCLTASHVSSAHRLWLAMYLFVKPSWSALSFGVSSFYFGSARARTTVTRDGPVIRSLSWLSTHEAPITNGVKFSSFFDVHVEAAFLFSCLSLAPFLLHQRFEIQFLPPTQSPKSSPVQIPRFTSFVLPVVLLIKCQKKRIFHVEKNSFLPQSSLARSLNRNLASPVLCVLMNHFSKHRHKLRQSNKFLLISVCFVQYSF